MAINIQKYAASKANQVKTTSSGNDLGSWPVAAPDLSTPEGLAAYATSIGLTDYAKPILETQKKMSLLQRLSAGLSAFNPAQATSTALTTHSLGAGIKEYAKDVGLGLASAVTGNDYLPERKYFKDVLEQVGVENGILKYGLGFVGDVILDPSTYFGGSVVRAMAKTSGVVAEKGLVALGRAAPEAEAGLRLTGKGFQNAFGRMFKYAYDTSGQLGKEYLQFQTKLTKMASGIGTSNLERLGAEAMPKALAEQFVERTIAGRVAEYSMRDMLGEALVQKQTEAMTNASKLLKATQKMLGGKIGLNSVLSLTKEEVAKLTAAGYDISKLAKAGEIATFQGNVATPLTDEVAKILGITPERAIDLSNQANGILTYAGMQNDAYIKQMGELSARMKDIKTWKIDYDRAGAYGTKIALDGADPLMEEAYKKQMLRNMKFAQDKGITEPYRNYYPAIKNDKDTLRRMLAESNRQGVRVGSQGWAKKFNNLIDQDEWLKNAPQAFTTRETAMARDFMSRDFLTDAVTKYGKPLDAYPDARKAMEDGYRLMTEKGAAGGLPIGEKIGWLKEADFNFINGQINDQYPAIAMIAKATGFDALNRLFKRSVTVPFLPFHVRNFVSGMMQNYEVVGASVLRPEVQASATKLAWAAVNGAEDTIKGTITLGGKAISMRKVMKPFFDLFGNDPGMWKEMAGAMEKGVVPTGKILSKASAKATLKTAGLGEASILFRGGRAVSNFVEIQQKAVAYIATLGKGLGKNAALDAATKAGFNYNALTPFESQIMRRIIPFYSFTRFNIGLQLRTLGENPQRVNHILRMMNVGQTPTADEKLGLPNFIRESLGMKVGDLPNGIKVYLARFGTPVESFTDIMAGNPILQGISMMSPALKVPIELGIGKDSFRETDLKDTYSANDISVLPQFMKDALDMTPVLKPVLRKDSSGKLTEIGKETVWVADPVKLLIFRSLFTSRGITYIDKLFAGDLKGLWKVLSLTTGVRPYNVNPEAIIAATEKAKERELIDMLQMRGNVKTFTRPFIPGQ